MGIENKIIFFEGECPLCHRAVLFILKRDRKKLFLFAPLGGKTALEKLPRPIPQETLILLDGGKIYSEGKAIAKICWRLGGVYRLFAYFPSWIYRRIAKHRHHLFQDELPLLPSDRLLP
ncbi:MAG: thiol-disulfide oxidoreductase DCC family protein [Chlamydiales bacterium]